jgi:preprotein translocase subunit YajC
MGNLFLASSRSSSSELSYLIIIVLIGLFYLLIFRPQRRRQQRAAQTQSAVTPGTRIRTTAGIYGTVVSTENQDVIVQIAPGVEIRMLRRAVLDVVPDDEPSAPEDGNPDSAEPHTGDSRSDDWDSPDRNV